MTGRGGAERARLVSNYLRLLVTFGSGLLVVRLVAEIGPPALVLYLLILAGTGFAQAFKIVLQESVIPVLGLSYDGRNARPFAGVYWFSLILSLVAGGLSILIYAVIGLFADTFDFGDLPHSAFFIALVTAGVRTVVSSASNPALNAILISGRVVAYNLILAGERLVDVVAVLLVLWALSGGTMAEQITWFFILSAALYAALQVACYLHATRIDPRFRAAPAPLSAEDKKWVSRVFGWNVAVVVAFILYLRYSTFLINGTYGPGPTLILGLVFLLIGYQRQISMGLVIGLDAAVSRLVGGGALDGADRIKTLLMRSTYIQGVFSFVSLAVLFLFVEEIFALWFGDSLAEGGWNSGEAATLFRIMAIGVLARSLSEVWMKFLSGQGLVGRYAGVLLAAAITNAIVITAVALFSGWEAYPVMVAVALSFSVLYVLVHLVAIPVQLSRSLGIGVPALYGLLAIPALAVAVATGLSWIVIQSLPIMVSAPVAFGLLSVFSIPLLMPGVVRRILRRNEGLS